MAPDSACCLKGGGASESRTVGIQQLKAWHPEELRRLARRFVAAERILLVSIG